MVSMADVAAAAGVSPATVSRVLSNSVYPVRGETRERVLEAARTLGFRPNMLARALVTSRTGIVAVLVHDIADPYFAEIVRGVEDVARKRGYQVLVSSSDRDPEREVDIVELLLAYSVDALIFAGGSLLDDRYEKELRRLVKAFALGGRAVVQLAPHQVKATRVTIDNRAGAAAMTAYLTELGHRRIGHIAGPAHLSTARLRTLGYRDGLEHAGIAYDPALVVPDQFSSEGGRAAAATLLDQSDDVTAIFAANDAMAFGAMVEVHARGLGIPDDLSVAGFDDVPAAEYVSPALTTVAMPMRRVGREGFEIALKILDGKPARSRTLPTELITRSSTGLARPKLRPALSVGSGA